MATMTSYTSAAGRKLTAVDPSEIVILVDGLEIPCKSVQPKRSIKLTPELATGSHLPRGLTVGDIGYEISFTVGTFVNDPAGERNATMWNNLLTEHLEYPEDEGIPKYFTIRITDRRTGVQIQAFEYCRLQEDAWNIGQGIVDIFSLLINTTAGNDITFHALMTAESSLHNGLCRYVGT